METGMLRCKTVDNLVEEKKLKDDDESSLVDKGTYQRLVGRLIYLLHPHPDITYAVSVVSRFMYLPRESHMEAFYKYFYI